MIVAGASPGNHPGESWKGIPFTPEKGEDDALTHFVHFRWRPPCLILMSGFQFCFFPPSV
jgi:hypothetical protein